MHDTFTKSINNVLIEDPGNIWDVTADHNSIKIVPNTQPGKLNIVQATPIHPI